MKASTSESGFTPPGIYTRKEETSESNVIREKEVKPFGSRKIATAAARRAITKSDIQERLGEMGGFVWKVEMWPNWLSISVDALGNNERDSRAADRVSDTWAGENQEKLQEMFSEVLGDRFPELSIMGRSMGLEEPYGTCCRTGCGGGFNGRRDRLVHKLQDPSTPIDRFG